MKKKFEQPVVFIVRFTPDDVVTASGGNFSAAGSYQSIDGNNNISLETLEKP